MDSRQREDGLDPDCVTQSVGDYTAEMGSK